MSGSPLGSQKVMGYNPLSSGAQERLPKVGSLAGAALIPDAQWASLLARLKGVEANEERLAVLEKEKVPYMFTSAQLMALIDLTLSVKTRIAMIQHVGPRLIDPRAKASQLVGLFRYSEEKEKVESVLKARTQAVMANTSLFRPQGLASTIGVAENNHHPPPPPQQQQQKQKQSVLANVQVARQPKSAIAVAPRVPIEEMSNLSVWQEPPSQSQSKSQPQSQPLFQSTEALGSAKMQASAGSSSSHNSSHTSSSHCGILAGSSSSAPARRQLQQLRTHGQDVDIVESDPNQGPGHPTGCLSVTQLQVGSGRPQSPQSGRVYVCIDDHSYAALYL